MSKNISEVIAKCKFTPLGFETRTAADNFYSALRCVNLPRWGLKPTQCPASAPESTKRKFTPLGFETDKSSQGVEMSDV